jgi:ubiquinone biosynthesis monooxygenase Coq7
MLLDQMISEFDRALRAMTGVTRAARPDPAAKLAGDLDQMSPAERRHSAGLMRVNHVGEVCAQALYQAQKMTAQSPEVRTAMARAAREEEDHLAWCATRLEELGSRPSLLNPLWFTGAFSIGWLAGKLGDRVSLGFVAETERQVERHLDNHLGQLPANDAKSRIILETMRADEIQHGEDARRAGGVDLPAPVRGTMRLVSRVMTSTAYYI